MECLFCKIIKNEAPSYKVWEDENFLAFLDIKPIKHGHILLIPKIHLEDVFEVDDKSYTDIFIIAKKLIPYLKEATSVKRIGMVVAGFGVPHVHIHLVPINSGEELNPELAKGMSAIELENMQVLIKDVFKDVI